MATSKITISLRDNQIGAVRALIMAGRSPNVSAFVQHAVGVALFDAEGWRDMLEERCDKRAAQRPLKTWAESPPDLQWPTQNYWGRFRYFS
jgi:Arc/MetJ-type ribon-helix-helix transcriptional regulator